MDETEAISASIGDQDESSLFFTQWPDLPSLDCGESLGFCQKQNTMLNPMNDSELTETDVEKNKSPMQMRRWQLAAQVVSQYPAIRSRFEVARHGNVDNNKAITHLEPSINAMEDLVVDRVENWPSAGLLGGLIMGMILWFASMAFGGIHAAAWNGYFPSTVEFWMWRASSVHVVFCGLLWLVINLLAKLSKPIDMFWDRVVALQERRMTFIFLGILCFIGEFTFVIARIYLVLEAFVSLRQLPVAAYETPDWTQLVPHF